MIILTLVLIWLLFSLFTLACIKFGVKEKINSMHLSVAFGIGPFVWLVVIVYVIVKKFDKK